MVKRRMALLVGGWTACLGFVAAPARGTLMTFAFEGVVDSVIDWDHIVFPDLVYPGDALSGTATIDIGLPDLVFPDFDFAAQYPGAVVAMSGTVGDVSFSLTTPETSEIGIRNNAPPFLMEHVGPWDRLDFGGYVDILGYSHGFGFSLVDYSGTAFPDEMGDSLPTTIPPLDAFQPSPLGDSDHPIRFAFGPKFKIDGTLSLVQTVPEPGSALLFLLGSCLVLRRRG